MPYGAILKPVAVTPCSSDVHTVFGGGSKKQDNLVLGHECIAEVVSVGENVCDFKTGDRVAVPAITPDWREKSIQEGNDRHASAPFSGHQLGRTQPGVFSERFLIKECRYYIGTYSAENIRRAGVDECRCGNDRIYRGRIC